MKLSIVMTHWDGGWRRPLLVKTWSTIAPQWQDDYELIIVDDGPEPTVRDLAEQHGRRYFHLQRDGYNNRSRAMNIGIRQACGDVVLLQCPEVYHGAGVIKHLLKAVNEHTAVFPTCWSLDKDGMVDTQYCGPKNRRPVFFCGAMLRKHFLAVNGIDEDYTLPGWDDNDLAMRLFNGLGLRAVFRGDLQVYHQWHPRPRNIKAIQDEMEKVFRKKYDRTQGGIRNFVCNQNREWGSLEPANPTEAPCVNQ